MYVKIEKCTSKMKMGSPIFKMGSPIFKMGSLKQENVHQI